MEDVRDIPHFEPPKIAYNLFADALTHYEASGYPYREVPWVVSTEAVGVTLPADAEATTTQYGDLVGSGEQSFIELMMRGESIIRACCITPCFRLEPAYDRFHHGYFMKLELIDTVATEDRLRSMIGVAAVFFEKFAQIDIVQTDAHAYDIVTKSGVELGSYGFRDWSGGRFIYGTGLALPRLTTACQDS